MPDERFMRHHYGASGYVAPKPEQMPKKHTAITDAELDRMYRLNRSEWVDRLIAEALEARRLLRAVGLSYFARRLNQDGL